MHKLIQISILLFTCLSVASCGAGPSSTSLAATAIASGQTQPTAGSAGATTPPPATTEEAVAPSMVAAETVAGTTVVTAEPATSEPVATVASVTPDASTLEATPVVPVSAGGDAVEAILHAMLAETTVKSYRMKRTITISGTMTTVSLDAVLPDRFHMISQGAGHTTEALMVGGTSYVRRESATWRKMLQGAGGGFLADAFAGFHDPKQVDEFRKGISEARLVGREVVDGSPAFVYEYRYTSPVVNTTGTEKLWIGVDDGLIRKGEIDSVVESKGQTIPAHTTVVYSDYNAAITIAAPLP